jgi:hypothetical protein
VKIAEASGAPGGPSSFVFGRPRIWEKHGDCRLRPVGGEAAIVEMTVRRVGGSGDRGIGGSGDPACERVGAVDELLLHRQVSVKCVWIRRRGNSLLL